MEEATHETKGVVAAGTLIRVTGNVGSACRWKPGEPGCFSNEVTVGPGVAGATFEVENHAREGGELKLATDALKLLVLVSQTIHRTSRRSGVLLTSFRIKGDCK